MIHYFSLALILGIVVGTYSSIFVAANLVLSLNIQSKDLMPPEDDDKSQKLTEEVPYS